MEIRFLGTRGSMPTGGKEYLKYGSDTSSYMVSGNDAALFFDAGTGICHAPDVGDKKISILLSHLHLDHIMGLTFFPMFSKDVEIEICSGLDPDDARSVMDRVFSAPFWPCTLSDYRAKVVFKKIEEEMVFGDLKVSAIHGSHPDGCYIFKAKQGDHSVCYATDYEHGGRDGHLIEFAKGCDCLIYDGQYTVEEYDSFKGFGHSTKDRGIEIAKAAGVDRIVFTHHDPRHTDQILDAQEERLKGLFENVCLAKQGEVIEL